MRLQGKVAIITGSSSGLGKATAILMAAEGASVVVNGRNVERMQEVRDEINASGGKAIAVKADVANPAEVASLLKQTVSEFGRIDILVNNAGITRYRPFLQMDNEDWDAILDVDLKGVFWCCQAVVPYMMQQKYGKIVNISSVAGTGVSPDGEGKYNYASAKAGVIQITKLLALELGPHGINVNCVAPGFFITPISYTRRTPEELKRHAEVRAASTCLKRAGNPEELANAVLFLASDESSFITGQLLCVDGGRTDRL